MIKYVQDHQLDLKSLIGIIITDRVSSIIGKSIWAVIPINMHVDDMRWSLNSFYLSFVILFFTL